MTESEIIDEILSFKADGVKIAPVGVSSAEYTQAFEIAIEHGLVNHYSKIHIYLHQKASVLLG